MSVPSAFLPPPALLQDADGTLRSEQFGDVYFSREGGSKETEHVFLNGNDLPARWMQQPDFTIGELGFGSGLNFLVTWKKFLETAPPSHRLHFFSCEQYPLSPEMLSSALAYTGGASVPPRCADACGSPLAAATQDKLEQLRKQLIARYPLRLPGIHRIHFDRVTLTLAFGDARNLLPQVEGGEINAWFLDGFSPAKNPELWDENILSHVARLSAPDATLATYTVASAVRRSLEAYGFILEKRRGFGKKREMLVGRRCAPGGALNADSAFGLIGGVPAAAPPRFADARGSRGPSALRKPTSTLNVLVVGGGIAGCTVAHTLAERGVKVTLLEHDVIASGASGNMAAALYPQITKTWLPATAWHFTAYSFTLRRLARWKEEGLDFGFASPGMVRVAGHDDARARLRYMQDRLGLDPAIAQWMDADALSEKLGMELHSDGAWFPHGSWLKPAELCRALVQHPNITLHEQAEVTALARTDGGWHVTTQGSASFDGTHVVLANAQDAKRFVPDLALGMSAGQVSILLAASASTPLRHIFCHRGYVIPGGDHYLIGATYDHSDFSCAVTDANHKRNIDELARALPGWLSAPQTAGGRTALRATTPDRLPYVGEIAGGLYVSTGFGSRGMISAPLAAEVIASHITGDIIPLTSELRTAIAPLRRQTSNNSVRTNPSRTKIAS